MRPRPARRTITAALAAAAFTLTAGSARAETIHETQQWAALAVTARLTGEADAPGLSGWLDEHVRNTPDRTTFILRPGLGYRFTSALSAWAGYAWVPTILEDAPTIHEHRAWQQGIVQGRAGRLLLQGRPRLEQRFRDGEDEVGLRARLFGRMNVRVVESAAIDVALWDEIFLGLNDTAWGQEAGYDQNRAFVGPAWTSGPVRFELGYLNVAQRRPDATWLVAHNVSLWAFVSL